MSWSEAPTPLPTLMARSKRHEFILGVFLWLLLVGMLGFLFAMAGATSVGAGATFQLICRIMAGVCAVCFATGIAGAIWQHKYCSATSKALLARANSRGDCPLEPLLEGEHIGSFEVLSCEESLVMLSRNRSLASEVTLRILLFLAGIGLTAALILAVAFYGFDFGGLLLRHHKAIWLYASPLASIVLIFLAIQRRPTRWYASREEDLVRIETIRWIAVREIIDLRPGEIISVVQNDEFLAVNTMNSQIKVQHVSVPGLAGIFINKDERERALNELRELQCQRVYNALVPVFRGHRDWKLR